MIRAVTFTCNKASAAQVEEHLIHCDSYFTTPLSARVNIADYALKITTRAVRFEAWQTSELIGLVAMYINQESERAFITSVSVLPSHQGKGIAASILEQSIICARQMCMSGIELEVEHGNVAAQHLYLRKGFKMEQKPTYITTMLLNIREYADE